MMDIKLLEIRDRGTFMPTMAIRLRSRDEAELFLLRRAGYGEEQITGLSDQHEIDYQCQKCKYLLGESLANELEKPIACPNKCGELEIVESQHRRKSIADPYVILVKLDGVQAQYDPFSWSGIARTLPRAHMHVIEHWNEIASGDVIDVEFIDGATSTKKVSERLV